jgi:hypothetical protein
MKDQVLDSPEDFEDFYGRNEFSYIVSNTGNLVIRLRFNRRDFWKKMRPALAFLAFGTVMTAVIAPVAGEDAIGVFLFVTAATIVFYAGPRLLFLLFKKVEWEFSGSALTIKNFAGRKRVYDREDIKEVFIMRYTDADYSNYYDIKYWIVLKVPDHVYEDGKLYLFVVQGINSKHAYPQDLDLLNPPTGIEDTENLARMIAEHWEIPFRF